MFEIKEFVQIAIFGISRRKCTQSHCYMELL